VHKVYSVRTADIFADVERCCRLVADLSRIDVEKLDKEVPVNGKRPFYKIWYTLRPSVLGVRTRWELVVPDLDGIEPETADVNIAAAFKPGEGN
jgi:hypothetical protein